MSPAPLPEDQGHEGHRRPALKETEQISIQSHEQLERELLKRNEELARTSAVLREIVEGVEAKIGLHVCFGNFHGRPRTARSYRRIFPGLLDARVDQFALEFANREMVEVDLLGEIVRGGKDAGAGVVDVKSFWVEPAEEVAERVRECLKHVPPDRLTLLPDCGFFQLPRWLCAQKLRQLVAGVQIVRRELEG